MSRWKIWCLWMVVIAAAWLIGGLTGQRAVVTESDPLPKSYDSPSGNPPNQPAVPSWSGEKRDHGISDHSERELSPGAILGQRTVSFSSAQAMRRFLDSLDGTGIKVLGSIDSLHTLRLGITDSPRLDSLLDGSEEIGFIFPAEIPAQGTVQAGAVAFGSHYLSWLGATGERTHWGINTKVAVLDTGVVVGELFANPVYHQNLVPLPSDPAAINGHGTAVASLIAGIDGVAPGASILSYRIAGDDGRSDTFRIAEAVLAATDAGADIINISLGSNGASRMLEEAINYAANSGVLVVASAGNSGGDTLLYPAAYDKVIGVGAVDARGEHLNFSNTGKPSIVAPGLGLTSRTGEGNQHSFSGTSASSPLVAGAIAAAMTQQATDSATAWQQIETYANEAGAPGVDPTYGVGILDVGRVLDSGVSGIYDVALASNHLVTNGQGNAVVQVTVENRGTASVVNASVTVKTALGTSYLNITTLAPGAIHTFEVPVGRLDESARIESSVGLSGAQTDKNPYNNIRVNVVASK